MLLVGIILIFPDISCLKGISYMVLLNDFSFEFFSQQIVIIFTPLAFKIGTTVINSHVLPLLLKKKIISFEHKVPISPCKIFKIFI